MKRLKVITILIMVLAITLSMVYVGCGGIGSSAAPTASTKLIYGGSDPRGDYIAVEIDKVNKTVTHYNYTQNQQNGPYPYTQVDGPGTEKWGFSMIYKVTINDGSVDYALFAEYENAAIVYQLFDSDNKAIDNPQYAIIREQIPKSDVYGKAYNWMKFTIDMDGTSDNDMECGFAAWDSETANGLLYGASYSALAEALNWSGYTNGVSDINDGDTTKVDDFVYDSNTISNYVQLNGGTGMDYRLTMTGTPSGTNILDFGPEVGGGSGLAIPQASSSSWNSNYNGTYFIISYQYEASTETKSVQPLKCVLSGTGTIKVFDITADTSSATPFFQADLIAVKDLPGSSSPGGTVAISTQFATISGNSSADSSVVQSANECPGAYVGTQIDGNNTTLVMVMFDPDGKFGGFTGFTDSSTDARKNIMFGFTIKDPNYSDSNL